jgi:hypothetical protein
MPDGIKAAAQPILRVRSAATLRVANHAARRLQRVTRASQVSQAWPEMINGSKPSPLGSFIWILVAGSEVMIEAAKLPAKGPPGPALQPFLKP